MPKNVCTPLFTPGKNVSVILTANVVGKTFVDVSAAPDVNGTIKAATAAAGARAFGVAAYDGATGELIPAIRGGIVPVTAGGTIAVGADVEVGAAGKAITLASGKAVGKAVKAGTNGADVLIALY